MHRFQAEPEVCVGNVCPESLFVVQPESVEGQRRIESLSKDDSAEDAEDVRQSRETGEVARRCNEVAYIPQLGNLE